jgi:hypothetical protein
MQTCSPNKHNLMYENILAIVAIIVFLIVQALFFYWTKDSFDKRTVKYDCTMSWHPDFPVEVKKACQELRVKNGRF